MLALPLCALFYVGIALLLTGCNTTREAGPPPIAHVNTVAVGVPVARSCVPATFTGPPTFVDTDAALKAAPGPGEALQILSAGRKQHYAYEAQTDPIIEGCRK